MENYNHKSNKRFPAKLKQLRDAANLTQEELAQRAGLTANAIAKFERAERLGRKDTHEALAIALGVTIDELLGNVETTDAPKQNAVSTISTVVTSVTRAEKHGVPLFDKSSFFGREHDTSRLKTLLITERARLIGLFGMGGIGKTSLSKSLTSNVSIENYFSHIIWISLKDPRPLQTVLKECLRFITMQNLPEADSSDFMIEQLIQEFTRNKCLIIFDNLESILKEHSKTGQYQEGFEDYGRLLQRVASVPHESCILITSREKPEEFRLLESSSLQVYSHILGGLAVTDIKMYFEQSRLQGKLSRPKLKGNNWDQLVSLCQANILSLNLAVNLIEDQYNGNIDDFLENGEFFSGRIEKLFDSQFERLSEDDKLVMYWLAIERDAISLLELAQDLATDLSDLSASLQSLYDHSMLVRTEDTKYSLLPIFTDYVTKKMLKILVTEIVDNKPTLLHNVALVKATAEEFNRQTQIRVIIEPVIKRLRKIFKADENLVQHLFRLIRFLKNENLPVPGASYAAGNLINLLRELKVDFTHQDLSNLTIWQANFKGLELREVNFSKTSFHNCTFTENFDNVLSLAFSPDQKVLAVGTVSGDIRISAMDSGKQILTYSGHKGKVRALAFSTRSSNGENFLLASGSEDGTIMLWDIGSPFQKPLKTLNKLDKASIITSLAFNSDGSLLASGSDSGVKIWNVNNGKCLYSSEKEKVVWAVVFSPDGSLLATGGDDQTVNLWNLKKTINITLEKRDVLKGHFGGITSLAFSKNGKWLASGSQDCTVILWDVALGSCFKRLESHTSWIKSVDFSPDSKLLVSGSEDRTIKLWDVESKETKQQYIKELLGHTGWVEAVAFSSDGQLLASGSEDSTVRLWDLSSGNNLKTIQGYTNRIWSIAFNPQVPNQLAVAGEDRSIKLWDIENEKVRSLSGHAGTVCSVAFSQNGKLLVSGSDDHTVKLWNVESGYCLMTLRGHKNRVWSVAISPDGQLLASGSEDFTVRVWDVFSGKCLKILKGHRQIVNAVMFVSHHQLISTSDDGQILLWDLEASNEEHKLIGSHRNWIFNIGFNPHKAILASASEDQSIILWSIKGSIKTSCIQTLRNQTGGIRSVAFSHNGTRIASGSSDFTVAIWQNETKSENHYYFLKTLSEHSATVRSVAFKPDDANTLASGSEDGSVKIWSLSGKDESVKTLRILPYKGMKITDANGLDEEQRNTLVNLGADYS